MNELKRNASGYCDPTAYNAMKKICGGGVERMEVYRGDIFYVRKGGYITGSEQDQGRPAVIVSNDIRNHRSNICEAVYLTTQDKKPLPTHVEVMCKVPSIALCEQIVSVSQERLGEFVRSCTEAEMKAIDKALMVSLGLDFPLFTDVPAVERVNNQEIDNLKMKLEGAEKELDEKKAMLNEVQIQLVDAHEHIKMLVEQNEEVQQSVTERVVIELTTERNLYKSLYEQTFERMIAR